MRPLSLVTLFALSVSLAYGQLDSNTITVTANRTAAVQPDQAVFQVSVSSGINTSLDDVLAALASSGVTRANFSGVNASPLLILTGIPSPAGAPPPPPIILWNFTLAEPLSKIKDTVTMLTALQKTIMQNNSGLTLLYSIQGTQVSPQLQQMQTCSIADLLADARTEAQKLANAANLFLGPVLAMSALTTSSTGGVIVPGLVFNATPPCTLTVKFAVTR